MDAVSFPSAGKRGACFYCRHLGRGRCLHPDARLAKSWREARDQGGPCGPSGKLWEKVRADLSGD